MPTVELASLGLLRHVRDDRGTSVYAIEAGPGRLLRQYHRPDRVDFRELARLRATVDRSVHPYRRHALSASWPIAVVTDANERFAVTEPAPDQRFTVGGRPRRLTDLIEPPLPGQGEATASAAQRLAVALSLARYVEALHRSQIVLGGVNPDRLLWSATELPEVHALDCDRHRIIGHPPALERDTERSRRDDCRDLCLVTAKILLALPDLTPQALASDPERVARFGAPVRRLIEEVAAGSPWPLAVRWRRALELSGFDREGAAP